MAWSPTIKIGEIRHVQFSTCTDTVYVSNSLPRVFSHECDSYLMWKSLTAYFDTCIEIHVSDYLTRVFNICVKQLDTVFQYSCPTGHVY